MLDSSADIGGFLAQQAAEGRRIDSGEFTLDSAKARAKLSEFSLAEPGLWVVKLVQAAVASGAPDIEFTMPKREVKVCFLNKGKWCADDICSFVLSARAPADRGMAHLQAGLLASSMGEVTDQLVWECGGKRVKLSLDGVEAEDVEDDGYLKIHLRRSKKPLKSPNFFSSPLRYYFRETAHEFQALVKTCRCSPIPIKIDGFDVQRFYAGAYDELPKVPGYDSEKDTGRREVFAVVPLSGLPSNEAIHYPLLERIVPSEMLRFSDKEEFSPAHFPPEDEPVKAVLVLYSGLQRRSQVNYVVDGAIVDSKSDFEDHPQAAAFQRWNEILMDDKDDFPFQLYVSNTPDQVDLSHFQVKNSVVEGLEYSLSLALQRAFLDIRDNCHKPWNFILFDLPSLDDVKQATAADVLGTGFMSLFIPHMVVLGGSALILAPFLKLYKPHGDKKKAEALIARSDVVISGLETFMSEWPSAETSN